MRDELQVRARAGCAEHVSTLPQPQLARACDLPQGQQFGRLLPFWTAAAAGAE